MCLQQSLNDIMINLEEVPVEQVKSIALTLTHNCNLRCSYCYEKHGTHKRMSLDTAISIVDRELTIDDGTKFVSLDFFGGEPILEFETIKKVVEHCRERTYPKEYHFEVSTNGTMFSNEIKEWFVQNQDIITIGLSLDGNRTSQNINRSNSFDLIDLEYFAQFEEPQIKMTISRETLPYLADNVIFCHKYGFNVACNLAFGIDWSDKSNIVTYCEQLNDLINFYLENDEYRPCTLLDIDRLIGVGKDDEPIQRTCGAGWAMRAYDCDGTSYPCQFFMPLSAGEEKAKESLKLKFTRYIKDDSNFSNECLGCIFVNSCAHCYGSNYATTGNMYEFDRDRCNLLKYEFKALAYFVSKLFENGRLCLDYKTVPSIVKGAINTEKYFSDNAGLLDTLRLSN